MKIKESTSTITASQARHKTYNAYKLYIYPIKSLRGITLSLSPLCPTGLLHDRTFMLLKLNGPTSPKPIENMHITYYPQMSLFSTSLSLPSISDPDIVPSVIVKYSPPGHSPSDTLAAEISIPLTPDIAHLDEVEVTMHQSRTTGYDMGNEYSKWFSAQFGFAAKLVFLGPNKREILGSFSPQSSLESKSVLGGATSWLGGWVGGRKQEAGREVGIGFADCANFLVVTEESLREASARFPEGVEMDVTKFRPNVVVSGAAEAWEEDFWGEVEIFKQQDDSARGKEKEGRVEIALTANCVRCTSINVDYETGQKAAGEGKEMLKLLMRDRRVDKGAKYSPVFGRYGFLKGEGECRSIGVGDEVLVVRRNEERTVYDWPGLTN